jgi:hypothetical protein
VVVNRCNAPTPTEVPIRHAAPADHERVPNPASRPRGVQPPAGGGSPGSTGCVVCRCVGGRMAGRAGVERAPEGRQAVLDGSRSTIPASTTPESPANVLRVVLLGLRRLTVAASGGGAAGRRARLLGTRRRGGGAGHAPGWSPAVVMLGGSDTAAAHEGTGPRRCVVDVLHEPTRSSPSAPISPPGSRTRHRARSVHVVRGVDPTYSRLGTRRRPAASRHPVRRQRAAVGGSHGGGQGLTCCSTPVCDCGRGQDYHLYLVGDGLLKGSLQRAAVEERG